MEKRKFNYFSDIELLSLMEAKGMKKSFMALEEMKRNISLYEDELLAKRLEKAGAEEEISPEKVEAALEPEVKEEEKREELPKVNEMKVVPSKVKTELVDPSYLSDKHANELLEIFLVEECGMTLKEYEEMSSDNKIESIKIIAKELLNILEVKVDSLDTTVADRSRGDIKQLRELPFIQDAITQLEALVERDENAIPEYSIAIRTIIKSILYINQYSAVFKEAYRNKKTLMILKYESLILSLVSSISYLVSTIVDYKADYLTLKRNVVGITEFAPLKSLENFINSVDSGEFKIVTKDTTMIREFYLEVPVEKMSLVLESTDYLTMVVDGIRNIYTDLVGSGKLTNLIYRAVGVIVLLFSLRDTFYSLFRMKTRVSEMLGGIQNFAEVNNGGNILQKLSQFAGRYRVDAENGSEMGKREIEDENRKLLNQVKSVQIKKPVENTEIKVSNEPVEDSIFGFDF